MVHITKDAFAGAFPRLILGRTLLPKKRSELQMLLTSVVFTFDFGEKYTERQVNELIQEWISRFGTDLSVDHVTLRRYLVDEGVLLRDESGCNYRLRSENPFFSYDPAIRELDLELLINLAHEERAARKRAHLTRKDRPVNEVSLNKLMDRK